MSALPAWAFRRPGCWPAWALVLSVAGSVLGQTFEQPPVYQAPPEPAGAGVTSSAAPPASPAPPPSAPAKRSAAELEKLVAPIALYPDPLLATLLPASVYPLEIVQAARFVSDTNKLAQLDAQPWDENVKAVARVPAAIKKMNDDLAWMIELGEAFLAQDKEVMDAIQTMRAKAHKGGTLQTTPQQIIVVTNMVVEKTVEQEVVVVTNTVVQIQPASSSVVYVPSYNPYTVYYPPPAYVYDPYAPLVGFAAGVAMGAIIANNCDWFHGGCYHGHVDINVDRNVNRNVNRDGLGNTARQTGAGGARGSSTGAPKKWQPDQNRLSKSGPPSASTSARSLEARGWGSGGNGGVGTRPSSGGGGARPSTGLPSTSRPTASSGARRPTQSSTASPNRSGSSGSAFGGMSSGAGARDFSNRGASSRSSGSFSGGRGGGGGGRGGGGRGGRR